MFGLTTLDSPNTKNYRDDAERWQLVKRFYLIDTFMGRKASTSGSGGGGGPTNGAGVGGDNEPQLSLSKISYAKSIEMRIQINDDYENSNEVNKISIPLLIIRYETIDMTNSSSASGGKSSQQQQSSPLNVDFTFSIKFVKRPDVAFFFQIVLPILILLACANSLMQTIFYRIREQKSEFDFSICANFTIILLSNMANVLAILAFSIAFYVFLIYKTQRNEIEILLPLKREQTIIAILLAIALTFKVSFSSFNFILYFFRFIHFSFMSSMLRHCFVYNITSRSRALLFERSHRNAHKRHRLTTEQQQRQHRPRNLNNYSSSGSRH